MLTLLVLTLQYTLMVLYSMYNLQVRAFLQPPMEGVVIQTYGAGKI